ncbi:MAG TPA: acyl carrier protein [Chloroflexia bacterium]|nr:acyl carrier protein [Chloroflexia bacterium]
MERPEIIEKLKAFISQDILDGRDIGLDETTPLLEWGVINSLEIVKLLNFIQECFGIEVPISMVVADYFRDIEAITDLVQSLAGKEAAA